MGFVRKLVPFWHKTSLARRFKQRRLKFVDKLTGGKISAINDDGKKKILDVGCANGKDFMQFLTNRKDLELFGIDIEDLGFRSDNFKMIVQDAEHLDFPDNYFDITVSMGVLEHVQPIEKLSKVIKEIDRVSKSYFVMVPAISTLLEPHTGEFFWQLKDRNKKNHHPSLNYYSDDAWMQFEGFLEARTTRFSYLPLLKKDLWIYNLKQDSNPS